MIYDFDDFCLWIYVVIDYIWQIETANGQLTEQLNIEINQPHTFWGLCTRLRTKLAAHTLCVYIIRLLSNPDYLQIKRLAFPN
jgi:membrane-bound metal-dependent hydrolase YbcI (DUF457 family)